MVSWEKYLIDDLFGTGLDSRFGKLLQPSHIKPFDRISGMMAAKPAYPISQ